MFDIFCFSAPVFWLHSVLAVVFLVVIVIVMRHFSVNLQYQEDEQVFLLF